MAVYDSFRGYIEHEDGLINQRLSWMLTIHGFLYATYGIVLTKQADIVSTLAMTEDGTLASRRYLHAMADEYNMLFMFTVAISVVGAGVSLLGWGSIRAAIASIKSVARTFRAQSWIISLDTTKHSEDQATGRRPMFDRAGRMVYLTKEGLLLPRMSGGTRRREALLGSAASTIIPLLLTGVWAFSIAWGYFHRINIRDVFAPLVAS